MKFVATLFGLLILSAVSVGQDDFTTACERSGFTRTPRYEETVGYCRKLAEASGQVHLGSFGSSAQGRDLVYLIADRDGLTSPEAIRKKGRIVLLIQACIHPGESEGKDAGMILLRDLLIPGYNGRHPELHELLDHVSILFIPIFNADGHERFGPNNRINQNGPEEMGWRVTANNLNLNRDFLKAETPEMKAWLALFNTWLPEFFVDTHTTDGADYIYPLTYLIEIFGNMDEGLTRWSREQFIPALETAMEKSGYPLFPYVDFRNWHDPRSGLVSEVAPPMLSQGYTALRNRPGLLIETHMLKPYDVRVKATYACLVTTLQILNRESMQLSSLEKKADDFIRSTGFLNESFPLQFQVIESDSIMVPFRGFEYTLEQSGVSGGSWFNYSSQAVEMNLPWFSNNIPSVKVSLPAAYIIPVEWEEIIQILAVHGVRIERLKKPYELSVSTYRFSNPKWQINPYEGRHPMTKIEYEEMTDTRVFPAGSAVIRVNQQAGRIIAHLLEPKGSGSLVWWGYFDAIFEQKEYAENYVLEKMAVRMLREDPALKQEFESKKAADSLFASNPQQILYWFYSKSPYIDQRKGIYPVGHITDSGRLDMLEVD